jgi:hypothetical protein
MMLFIQVQSLNALSGFAICIFQAVSKSAVVTTAEVTGGKGVSEIVPSH